ncbi:MAG: sugar phosphate isomerase/epimerase [Phototrophicales bacterium]|nr:MAG: sugar phosphate isomerase/epimerase [Phototrophicales bacterium]
MPIMTKPIALQLYSVREALAEDFEGVVRSTADMGYAGVETAGIYGESVESAARLFGQLGLRVPSAHVPLPIGDDKNRILDTLGALGCSYAVLAYLPPEQLRTRDQIKAQCERMNEGSANARSNGITLCYHNHWWEFEKPESLGGSAPLDVMLEFLDPAVAFEIDMYWVKAGGGDPAEIISRLGDRVPLLHIKDGSTRPADPMVAVGQGVMDYPALLTNAQAEWLVVELDRCATDMLQAVRESYTYLTERGLAKGR